MDIGRADAAHRLAEGVLSAGTRGYKLGVEPAGHSLGQNQTSGNRAFRMFQDVASYIPTQQQFQTAFQITKELKDGFAEYIAQEALYFVPSYHHLRAALAEYQYIRGDIAGAEDNINRIISMHSKDSKRPPAISINLAVALAEIHKSDDPSHSIKFFELAIEKCRPGMQDFLRYFITYAKLFQRLDRDNEALAGC